MDIEQLSGRYRRLKDELAAAYAEQPWPTGRIDRLAQEIAETEQAIAGVSPRAASAQSEAGPVRARATALPVVRNRLTPFGQRVAEPAAE